MKRLGSILLLLIGFLLVAELGARAGMYLKHDYNLAYLLSPAVSFEESSGAPAKLLFKNEGTYTVVDPCTKRRIEFVINKDGGRGNWPTVKPAGAVRILATGGSVTFGINNPAWATWPALLEQELRARGGPPVEVLNASAPSRRLKQINDLLPKQASRYDVDMAIFYETYSDAIVHRSDAGHVDVLTERFHTDSWIGRRLAPLYYRWSMLYTYLFERGLFLQSKGKPRVVPEIGPFQAQLRKFIRLIWEKGGTPVIVLQVTRLPTNPALQQVDLKDSKTVEAAILKATGVAAGEPETSSALQPVRAYQAQVLAEAARRVGETDGVQVIDPRLAFARYEGSEALFCDMVHLTDAGNRLLAQSIAGALKLEVDKLRRTGGAQHHEQQDHAGIGQPEGEARSL